MSIIESNRSLEQIVGEIEKHKESGGYLFDCPSFRLNSNERLTLHKAINDAFVETFKNHPPIISGVSNER